MPAAAPLPALPPALPPAPCLSAALRLRPPACNKGVIMGRDLQRATVTAKAVPHVLLDVVVLLSRTKGGSHLPRALTQGH